MATTTGVGGPLPVIGTTLNQRFALDRELGRGGMGAVYRATDLILHRTVAIKVLRDLSGDEVGRRLRLEAQILARLMHDNIVRLYDFCEDGGTFYFIMEEVDGTSFVKRWKKVELSERLRMLAQVADALDYAHHQGVIHRDVKPANVLLTAADQSKLSDFGLSVLADSQDDSGVVKGTPHYMSPEQARGKRLDHRTDLYSLGVILYEVATGTPPFTGASMAIMSQHVNGEVEPPRARVPDVAPELEDLILDLLAKAPDARPGSGREVAGRLRALIAGGRLQGGAAADLVSTTAAPISASPSGDGRPTTFDRPVAASVAPATVGDASPSVARAGATAAREVLDAVEAEPVRLTPDERYLGGHYLAYLLGGSRRKGFLRRRPLDPLNADRARLLLAMTYLSIAGGSEANVTRAAALIDSRHDVRPALSPTVVSKYLDARNTPGKRRRFRQARQSLQLASRQAAPRLLDDRGVLNPGLMPQVLDDLWKLAPKRTEVDDQLVQRWNRVTDVWRNNPAFREAVLRYATTGAWHDPASALLWPEVVYPLIERARWQRQLRSTPEVLWDNLCKNLHIPDAGNQLDRAIKTSVPEPVAEKLDVDLRAFVEEPELIDDGPADDDAPRRPSGTYSSVNPASFEDLEAVPAGRDAVRLTSPDPVRLALGELRSLWQEGLTSMRNPQGRQALRTVPIGPYRLTVVASIRARAAGNVAIQGMPNKQVELLVPSFTGGGSNNRPVIAAWVYANNSLVVTFLDHLGAQRYILWDAATGVQSNFDDPADLNHELLQIGLEAPDQLDRALSKNFRPRNPVPGTP